MVITISVCTLDPRGFWVTNWHQYSAPNDIDWQEVESFCQRKGMKGYGYMKGHKSRELTSDRNRTIIKEME